MHWTYWTVLSYLVNDQEALHKYLLKEKAVLYHLSLNDLSRILSVEHALNLGELTDGSAV